MREEISKRAYLEEFVLNLCSKMLWKRSVHLTTLKHMTAAEICTNGSQSH